MVRYEGLSDHGYGPPIRASA